MASVGARREATLATDFEGRLKEAELEGLLFGKGGVTERGFGDEGHELGRLASIAPILDAADADDGDHPLLMWEDRGGEAAEDSGGDDAELKPAWEDEGDERLMVDMSSNHRTKKLRLDDEETVVTGREYERRLRRAHAEMNPRTRWASLDGGGGAGARKRKRGRAAGAGDDDSDEGETAEDRLRGLMSSAGGLLGERKALPSGRISVSRLKDVNRAEPSNGQVTSVEFHPNGQLVMVAGLDRRLHLFQADGVRNPKVQTVHLEDMPIRKAAFGMGGGQIIACGHRKSFYIFDLNASKVERVFEPLWTHEDTVRSCAVSPSEEIPLVAFLGRQDAIRLMSLKSRQPVGSLGLSGVVTCASFSNDGQYLHTSGSGVVHTWDMRMRQCIHSFVDEGTIRCRSLAAADGKYFATGSSSGVVNIYPWSALEVEKREADLLEPFKPTLLKSVTSLTTPVDHLTFSPDAQMLAISSKERKDAMRLVHLPSCTVFSGFPQNRSPLSHTTCCAFSPGCGFLAVANERGRVFLYRLSHYSQA